MADQPPISPVRVAVGLFLVLPLLLALGGGAVLAVLYRGALPECLGLTCPGLDSISAYHPPEPPRIFDRDGRLVAQLSGPRRVTESLGALPPLLVNGFVAVEDRRFATHGGVDLRGGLRAAWRNAAAQGVEEGASTITMQLSRNIWGDLLEYGRWRRKLTEVRLAREIERRLTKEQILELYLNQIYLGDGVYGVATGASHYFGKVPADLTVLETALLVGLAKNPEGYNPRRRPEAAATRARTVVDVFERERLVSPGVADAARADTVRLAPPPGTTWGSEGYFIMAVRRELVDRFPDPRSRNGIEVHTTLDPRVQQAAAEALEAQIRRIEAGRYGAYRHPVPDGAEARAAGASPFLQGMVVVLDASDGAVRALVGGRDFAHSEFDRAFLSRRQPGSAFKPIVWAAALNAGYRLDSRVSTEPVTFERRGEEAWTPRDHVEGDSLTVRQGLVLSSNTVAARLGQAVGAPSVQRHASLMGIGSELIPWPSLFLGAAEVVPGDLVAAYTVFGNGGVAVRPRLVDRVLGRDGEVLYRQAPDRRQALSAEVAYLVLDALRDVTTEGTGWRVGAAGLDTPTAGKTGTTNEGKDVWYVGLTPDLVAGVWMGLDNPAPIVADAQGGTLAAPVWIDVVRNAGRSSGRDWSRPPGVAELLVDPLSDDVVAEECAPPDARVELVRISNVLAIDCGEYRESAWDWTRAGEPIEDSVPADDSTGGGLLPPPAPLPDTLGRGGLLPPPAPLPDTLRPGRGGPA